jgi:hypothetical protein
VRRLFLKTVVVDSSTSFMPQNDSSAPWYPTPSLHRSISLAKSLLPPPRPCRLVQRAVAVWEHLRHPACWRMPPQEGVGIAALRMLADLHQHVVAAAPSNPPDTPKRKTR